MGLVDLHGREQEEPVRALLRLASGSRAAATQDRNGEWRLVGWEENDRIVACAGVSRDGEGTVELHAISVSPGAQGRGVGRALVDALAEVVNAPSIRAQSDSDAVGFYRACGFAIDAAPPRGDRARFLCTRTLTAEPDPDSKPALTLGAIEDAVRASWSADTADDPTTWSAGNPARHHCDVSSLLVRELLGGEILIANVILDGRRVERHAWNRLSSGLEVDLTREQFRSGEQLARPTVGEPAAIRNAPERYELFAARVRTRLGLAVPAPSS